MCEALAESSLQLSAAFNGTGPFQRAFVSTPRDDTRKSVESYLYGLVSDHEFDLTRIVNSESQRLHGSIHVLMHRSLCDEIRFLARLAPVFFLIRARFPVLLLVIFGEGLVLPHLDATAAVALRVGAERLGNPSG